MSKSFHIRYILKGILYSLLLAFLLSAIFGVVLTFTSIPETDLGSNIIVILSVFIAALLNANKAGSKGLYYGLAIGFGFALISLLIAFIFRSIPQPLFEIGKRTLLSLISGAIGGIGGVFYRRA